MPRGVYERTLTKGQGPALKGRRVTLVPAEPVPSAPAVYVCTAKPLKLGEFTLTEGVEVPEADRWPRVDSWVSARRIRLIVPGEAYITWAEFIGSGYPKESQGSAKLDENLEPAKE